MPFGWYMGRRQGPVISLAILTIMLSGCLAAPVASWGDGSGEISTSKTGDEVTISADMNQYPGDYGPYALIGCNNLDNDGNVDKGQPAGNELIFSGYMANSILYETHSDDLKDGRDLGSIAAVIIDSMSMQAADEVVEGTGPKVFVKDWIAPTYPTTASGAGLDPVKKEGAKFLSLGLIPASENIIDGIHALETWHQAIEVHGYLLMEDNRTPSTGIEKSGNSCSISIDENANAHVYVTEIRLASGVVSEDGEDDDEWAMGDVDYLGRWGFITFFLIFGVGGAFGAFILSNMLLLRQAKNTAKTLMGEEGYMKAEKMKQDLRKSKKNKFDDDVIQRAPPKKEPKKPPKEEKKPEPESKLAGFSLDNILSKGSSLDSTNTISGGGGVTVTAEAVNMVKQNEQMSQSTGGNVSGGFSGGGVTSGVSGGGVTGGFVGGAQSGGGDTHFSSNSMNKPIERPDKPMKKRRATKKRSASSQQSTTQQSSSPSAPGPKRKGGPPPSKQQRPSVSDNDFDDFSDL